MRELPLAVRENFLRSPSNKPVRPDENTTAFFDPSVIMPVPMHVAVVKAEADTVHIDGNSG